MQYRVSGPDPAQVREIALKLGQTMGENSNLRLVNFDWMEPSREVRVRIDQDQARLLGLSSQTLAETLNAVMSGTPITQVRDGIYLINVVARANDEQRVSLSTLRSLQLPLPGGRTVPLSQVATFDFDQEYPLIWRRDRVPTLTVAADVRGDATPEGAVASLQPGIEKLEASLPSGYHIATGGTVEESAASQASVFALLPAALFLMLLFLMAQLHSFGRVALVVATVPLGLIGIVLALLLANRPLGFVAILGILALVGMIARNAVILIDQIETERAQGRDIWDAVVEATLSRFRPDHAHRGLHRAGPDPDRADGVLGPDGLRHHGRPVRRHPADASGAAGLLHHALPREAAARRRVARPFPSPSGEGGGVAGRMRDAGRKRASHRANASPVRRRLP